MSNWTIGQEVLRYLHREDKQPKHYRIARIERVFKSEVIILSNNDRFWENGIRVGDLHVVAPSFIEALSVSTSSEPTA